MTLVKGLFRIDPCLRRIGQSGTTTLVSVKVTEKFVWYSALAPQIAWNTTREIASAIQPRNISNLAEDPSSRYDLDNELGMPM